jgi:hypothetical protein
MLTAGRLLHGRAFPRSVAAGMVGSRRHRRCSASLPAGRDVPSRSAPSGSEDGHCPHGPYPGFGAWLVTLPAARFMNSS